ncbi:MAG: hypothetical protein V7774_11050 [Pseudorhizobium pelagicum]|uniref:hypothetical protein n=1 Tax=Pseudorhizobium pelagicum TaxID=1509405 RepID=UPI00345F2289
MPIESLNPEVWKLVGHMDGTRTRTGGPNFGWGSVPTENQKLTAAAVLPVYKLMQGDQSRLRDYYLVAGDVYHGIQGSPVDPSANWVSVGFYANYMTLDIRCRTPGARVMTFGPNSSVEQATVSFSIGGELSGEAGTEGGKGGASLSASVGVSFTASEVSFASRPSTNSISWRTSLPGVGWLGPATPPNPAEPSYAGYLWNPAVIFEVPQGAFPALEGDFVVDFEYNWTRGIRARGFNDVIPLHFQPDGVAATREEKLPTILERLAELGSHEGEPGRSDTFLAALQRSGAARGFGDSTVQLLVTAPTNAAFAGYFSDHPAVAAAAVSPANMRWLEDFLAQRIHPLTAGKVGPNLMTRIQKATTSSGDWFQCADGVLHLSDDYEVDPNLAKAAQEILLSSQ